MNYKISVIIPVYNAEKFLCRCLDSIINQSLNEIEIIIVNDGSTDNSLGIVNEYRRQDNRIQIITQENQGTGMARNNGISLAHGEYISFVDADDYIDLDMYENMYKRASNNKSDIVIARYRRVDSDGKTLNESQILKGYSKEKIFTKLFNFDLPSVSCSGIYKRTLFDNKECLYPIKNIYNEDTATIYKLYYFSKSISILDDVYYNWHYTSLSKTNSISQKHLDDMLIVLDSIKTFLLRYEIYSKYRDEFIKSIFKSILKKSYQIINFENNRDSQLLLTKNLLDSICNKNYFNKKEVLQIRSMRPTLYYTTLHDILKLSHKHIILNFFNKDDIQKIKSILKSELGLLQFIVDYIVSKKIKDIYIYGAGEILQKLFPVIIKNNINILGIIDNSVTTVKSPNKLYKVRTLENTLIKPNSDVLVSSISFADEISNKLLRDSKKNRSNLNIINFESSIRK